MDIPTFQSARKALTEWLESRPDWPDSRDPAFHTHLVRHNVTAQDYEKAITSLICWQQAPEQPYATLAAIAHTVKNRAIHTSPYQEAAALGSPQQLNLSADPDPKLERLLYNVDALYDGELYDPTQGSTRFVSNNLTIAVVPFRAVIGDYIFFKDPE